MSPLFYMLAVLLLSLLIFLLALWLLRKRIATVPTLTLVIAAAQYDHGDTVQVSGTVFSDIGVPAPNETVTLMLTDSVGTTFPVGTAVTDDKGNYTASFVVPSSAAPGIASLDATDANLGPTATATFTLSNTFWWASIKWSNPTQT